MQTLAIKYRPKTFSDVSEQDNIKTILETQIQTNTIKNAYLFCGGAGTGKTTCARIFANEINQGKGSPIELDAASNNGVDDVREINKQAKTKSLDSEYKIFIIDECVTGDVEILTSKGFKRFDECDGTEIVAQYTDEHKIEFVEPLEWIKKPYCGNLIKWKPRNWCEIKMTPNHVQPLLYSKSGLIRENYIKDVKFSQSNNLIVSGFGCGTKSVLTYVDRLVIASQADGTIQRINNNCVHWSIQLTKQRKIDRFLNLCNKGNIAYTEIKSSNPNPNTRRFTYDLPLSSSKLLSTHFNLNEFSYFGAMDFINEVVEWDGYKTDNYVEYISTEKENCDFVSAVACLGGFSARQRVQIDDRKSTYKDCYKVFLYKTETTNCQHIKKTVEEEYYDGLVYCVKVPSQKIVIRSGGFVFVTGNCHALSNSAWQSMLKLIEEPPAKTIFIFCTTDPQKIPKTILSRVQRYDFKRISQQGIADRLKYILEYENRDALEWDWENNAIEYIARLSDGGMRDAITMLDKCLSYSNELTLDNVLNALNLKSQDVMIELTNQIINKDVKLLTTLDTIYMSGTDLKQFIREYTNFIFDVKKCVILDDISTTHIFDNEDSRKLLKNANKCVIIDDLLKALIKLSQEIKFDNYPRYLIEYTLMEVIS